MNGLVRHPEAACAAVRAIDATVHRSAHGIEVCYTVTADLDHVRITEPRPPRFADNLWQHTCFELFVREQSSDASVEFNFSPSGEWAAYAFDRYREGMRRLDGTLRIAFRREGGTLVLDAVVPREMIATSALAAGLSAVIEDTDGAISYWALKHPSAKPDFHHRDAFALLLT